VRLLCVITPWLSSRTLILAQTEIRIDSSGGYYEVAPSGGQIEGQKLEQAQISLNDCLACRFVYSSSLVPQ